MLEEYLDAYLDAARIRDQAGGPLFRTLATAPGRPLSLNPMRQPDAWRMIRRRARAAGIPTKIGCQTKDELRKIVAMLVGMSKWAEDAAPAEGRTTS